MERQQADLQLFGFLQLCWLSNGNPFIRASVQFYGCTSIRDEYFLILSNFAVIWLKPFSMIFPVASFRVIF
jgi:hypothetical protein